MRVQTATRIGGCAFVVTGAGHLILGSLLPSTGDLLVIERQMAQVLFPIPPRHSMAHLMDGFSVTMSLLLIAWGLSVLGTTRHGRAPERAQVVLMLVLSVGLLVTAVLRLPAPPIVLMGVASVAFAVALNASRREAAPAGAASRS